MRPPPDRHRCRLLGSDGRPCDRMPTFTARHLIWKPPQLTLSVVLWSSTTAYQLPTGSLLPSKIQSTLPGSTARNAVSFPIGLIVATVGPGVGRVAEEHPCLAVTLNEQVPAAMLQDRPFESVVGVLARLAD